METIYTFNKSNQIIQISDEQLLKVAKTKDLVNYLNLRISYQQFCGSQTKSGQSRKNERARVRQRMFSEIETDKLDKEIIELKNELFKIEDSKIEKVKVKIVYDGRKDFSKIAQGIKMLYFTGYMSSQYYSICGLIDYEFLN